MGHNYLHWPGAFAWSVLIVVIGVGTIALNGWGSL